MTEWVMVNGARIERSFLDDNVLEARALSWRQTIVEKSKGHVHCMICDVALSAGDEGFGSEGGWLCPYCFTRFVAPAEAV